MTLFDIGDRIRERRRDRGLSQAELAELANLNYVTISKYESGKVEPGAKALARIADALDISVDALLISGSSPENQTPARNLGNGLFQAVRHAGPLFLTAGF